MSEFFDTTKQEEEVLKENKLEERKDNDLKKVLSFVEGRRLLFEILARAGIFKSSFTGNSTTFYLEGARSQGLHLLEHILRVAPDKFMQMLQENYSEMKSLEKKTEDKNARTN